MAGRSRRPGAGRPRLEDGAPGLGAALLGLVEPSTRGDPVVAVTWTTMSLRDLQRRLEAAGFRCGKDAAARMLREAGYSLQGMSRVLEGSQHPDRDGQFRHVNAMIAEFAAAGDPAVSVDAKKKEQLGPYHRAGRSWRPGGAPVRVRDHDFPDPAAGRIAPYGVYDIAANRGFVSVGTSHDTAAFAAGALRPWWRGGGSVRYPGARRAPCAPRARGGCWSPATPAAPTPSAPGSGSTSWRCWPRRPACRSASATSRPGPASGTRSSTGCSATSREPGAPAPVHLPRRPRRPGGPRAGASTRPRPGDTGRGSRHRRPRRPAGGRHPAMAGRPRAGPPPPPRAPPEHR